MNRRLAMWGWWHGKNLGDNWIKRTLTELFPKAEFIHTGFMDFSVYDFVICGGGGLYIFDTIKPWTNYTQKTPYGMLGLGAEFPHPTDEAEKLSRNAEFFYVRDQYSLDCMRIKNIERSYDITFAAPLSFTEIDKLDMSRLFFVWRDCLSLTSYEQFKDYIGYENNQEVYNQIISEEFTEVISDDFQTDGNDIENRIGSCGFVISGRYHGIVAAIQKGLPCIAIDICPKIRVLMRDCGLEEYCIKVNETNKLAELISRAKKDKASIREKQFEYREKAYAVLLKHIANAKAAVDRVLNPVRVLHYGSYWMKDNDVIKVMADDLAKLADVKEIDLKAYTNEPDARIMTKIPTPNGLICTLDAEKIRDDMIDFKPDAVILNSGGLVLEDSGFKMLSDMGVVSVGIELSDPDVFAYNGASYAHKFDLFYTNARYSFDYQYNKEQVNIHMLPFAASTAHHYYMPEIEKKYDLVVVGHAREDRRRVIKELSKEFNIGTYGEGWDGALGAVYGAEQTKAINSGLMYLSFAQTNAGFSNVKVGLFEAAACNQVVITRYMEELNDYFDIGKEIICYKDEEELPGIIEYYLTHSDAREAIRRNAYVKCLREHTYLSRWGMVKDDIIAFKEEKVKQHE
jgi:spore maturation protein CgeB